MTCVTLHGERRSEQEYRNKEKEEKTSAGVKNSSTFVLQDKEKEKRGSAEGTRCLLVTDSWRVASLTPTTSW